MEKRMISIFLVLFLTLQLFTPCLAAAEQIEKKKIYNAVYLGVKNYGNVLAKDKDNFEHRFNVDGEEVVYKVSNKDDYAINNILAEGYVFDLVVENNVVTDISMPVPSAVGTIQLVTPSGIAATPSAITVDGKSISITENTQIYEITSKAGGAKVEPVELETGKTVKVYGNPADVVYITFVAKPYTAPISGTPGQRTLKNFLATAMEPVGTSLYIYGGTWDWQDVGSSNQATTIGLSQTWIDFFQSQDANFTYRNSNPLESYYPFKAYNQYYYAGIDCSGYVGWVMYNIMNTESGGEGYVEGAVSMAKTFDETYGYGTWTHTVEAADFKPGDILSMNGHVWICLGVCDDGSLVILHSTPSDSRTGKPGGGVQISGVGENEDCQAYALAQEYMQRYFPAWSERYPAAFKSYSDYTYYTNAKAGKFSWNLDQTGVLDPDGYANMSAEEILRDLFSENTPGGGSGSSGRNRSVVEASFEEMKKTEELDTMHFDDVNEGDWFYNALKYVYDRGIVKGVSEKSFNPNGNLTRSMIVQILYNLEERPALSNTDIDSSIKDVTSNLFNNM